MRRILLLLSLLVSQLQVSSVSDEIFGKEDDKESPEKKKKKMTALAAEKAKRVCLSPLQASVSIVLSATASFYAP